MRLQWADVPLCYDDLNLVQMIFYFKWFIFSATLDFTMNRAMYLIFTYQKKVDNGDSCINLKKIELKKKKENYLLLWGLTQFSFL